MRPLHSRAVERLAFIATLALALSACGGGGGERPPDEGGTSPKPHVVIQGISPTQDIGGNESGTLELVLTNDGTAAATNVVISPDWPIGVSFNYGPNWGHTTCAASGGATCSATPWDLTVPSIPVGGEVRLQLLVAISGGAVGPLVVHFGVSADGQPLSNAESTDVRITTWSTTLRVETEGPMSLPASSRSVTWIVSVLNDGPDAARESRLVDTLDPAQSLLGVRCEGFGGAQCPSVLGTDMSLPGMPVGGRLRFEIDAAVAPGSGPLIANWMRATTRADVNPFDDEGMASTAIIDLPSHESPSLITLQSDPGDYLADGGSYAYTQVDSIFGIEATGEALSIGASGDTSVGFAFRLPGETGRLLEGSWAIGGYDLEGRASLPFFSGSFESRGCNLSAGVLTIDHVAYDGDTLQAIDMRLTQRCEYAQPALHAQIHWSAADTSKPAGPTLPIPQALWSPPASSLPADQNYVWLESYVGGVAQPTRLVAGTDVHFAFSLGGPTLQLSLGQPSANYEAQGAFMPMAGLDLLQPGYYPHLRSLPEANRAFGAVYWVNNFQACSTATGWMAVDHIEWSGTTLRALDMRFMQDCGDSGNPQYGQIHWVDPNAIATRIRRLGALPVQDMRIGVSPTAV